ncbi:MAG TPA: helix-turn-helix transcriptional regulator [Bryobacteraceae bacterium]
MPDHDHHQQPELPDADTGNARSGEGLSPQPRSPDEELDQVVDDATGSYGDMNDADDADADATDDAQAATTQTLDAFVSTIPDFVQADWLKAMPRFDWLAVDGRRYAGRKRIGGGFQWAIHLAVISQRSPLVVVPDVLFGQVVWGGDKRRWPSNWRQLIRKRLEHFSGGTATPFVEANYEPANNRSCPEVCPLHGTTVVHRHFSVLIRSADDLTEADKIDDEGQPNELFQFTRVFLGVMELYGIKNLKGERVYDFTLKTQKEWLDEEAFKVITARLRGFQREGRLVSVYLPLRLFGGSAKLGLSFRHRQLMLAIHRELTRDRKSTRLDKAAIVTTDLPRSRGESNAVAHYPGLLVGRRYVGFNGNGGGKKRLKYHGRGYRVLGDKGWLFRARYVPLGEAANAWPQMRALFRDLQHVGGLFGLIVAGRHMGTGEWLDLADLLERTKTPAGRKWLEKCVLRIYTEEDYLIRWRQVIAERMGFSSIPDRDQEQPAVTAPSTSAVQLLAYLRAEGVSQTTLARELGISKSLLSQYLNGHKTWTTGWQERLNAWIADRKQDRPR